LFGRTAIIVVLNIEDVGLYISTNQGSSWTLSYGYTQSVLYGLKYGAGSSFYVGAEGMVIRSSVTSSSTFSLTWSTSNGSANTNNDATTVQYILAGRNALLVGAQDMFNKGNSYAEKLSAYTGSITSGIE
jgi:hypothetical protein